MASRIDTAIGTIDGANTDFTLPHGFVSNTVVVFINGQLRSAGQTDGWTIVGTTIIRLNEAPRVGDLVQAFYRESNPTPVPPGPGGSGGSGGGSGGLPPC